MHKPTALERKNPALQEPLRFGTRPIRDYDDFERFRRKSLVGKPFQNLNKTFGALMRGDDDANEW